MKRGVKSGGSNQREQPEKDSLLKKKKHETSQERGRK